MKLYIWRSSYLENYGRGTIAVMAVDEDVARSNARHALLADLKERFDYLYDGLTAHEVLADEHIREKQDKIEADLSATPVVQLNGVLLVSGSE